MAILPITLTKGGISDENTKGPIGSHKMSYGLDIHSPHDGIVGNGSLQAETEALSSLIVYFVSASDGSTYGFTNTGSIYARNSSNAWNLAYSDENGEIKGAAEFGLSDGTQYLFWATNTSLARKLIKGTGVVPWTDATADWRTTLDPADYHTMKPAGGALQIANNNYLAQVAYDGTFDVAALDIHPGTSIKTVEERDDYVILGSYKDSDEEEGHLWSWLTSAASWIQKKRIPVRGVNVLIEGEFPLLQGVNNGEIFAADFLNNIPLARLPGEAGQVNPGGATVHDDLAMFGFYGTSDPDGREVDGIWSYGRKQKDRGPALNYEYRMSPSSSGSTIVEVGALKSVGGKLLASWQTDEVTGSGDKFGVDASSTTVPAQMLYESLEFDGGTPFISKKFNTVKLAVSHFAGSYSGVTVSVKYRPDKKTSWKYAFTGTQATTYTFSSTASETPDELIFSIGDSAKIFELGLEIVPNATQFPIFPSVTTYLDDVGQNYG